MATAKKPPLPPKKVEQPKPAKNPVRVPPKSEDELGKEFLRKQREEEMDRKMNEAYERFRRSPENDTPGYAKGGPVKYAKGGKIDGCAHRGKTKGMKY